MGTVRVVENGLRNELRRYTETFTVLVIVVKELLKQELNLENTMSVFIKAFIDTQSQARVCPSLNPCATVTVVKEL